MKNVSWGVLKTFAASKNTPMQYLDHGHSYEVFVVDGGFVVMATLDRLDVNAETTDFETNFKASANRPLVPRDANGREILTNSPFTDASGFRFRGTSMSGTVPANSTADIEFRIAQERFINGGRLLIDNIGPNDTMTFQVVDKDGILAPAGTVLDEFITGYFVPTEGNLEVKLDYPARVIAGLYLRLKYTSTHASGCTVKCNLYLHWKAS